MPTSLRPGAERTATVEVALNDQGKDYFALYQNRETGELSVLIDSFRGGEWTSTYLPAASTDALRKALNKAHRERND